MILHSNPVMDMKSIRVVRAVRGWSQRELAQAAGLSTWRVWRIEKGVVEPSNEEMGRLWVALSSAYAERIQQA